MVVSAVLDSASSAHFDEDILLVDRFLSGDRGAFQGLYERYYDKVFSIARGVLLDIDEAADAVQEIFTLVYRNLPRFDRRSRFSTWLFRIAVNRSIQQGRSAKHRSRLVPLQEAADKQIDSTFDPGGDPHIAAALERLQPSDRALLTLFYWEDMSLQEIAESIGCSVNAAKTRLFRARERFRTAYEGLSA